MSAETSVSRSLHRVQSLALRIGLVGTALLLVGLFLDPRRFLQAWLLGWLYWLGPALGSLAIVMLHNMTGGRWGFAIRRLLESAMRTLPFMALFFLPVLFGVREVYEWARPDVVAADPVLQAKTAYLNIPFFVVRALLYFGLWILLAQAVVRLYARYDRTLNIRALRRVKTLSGVGLAAYVLTMTFASFDWGMSLEPHWFSTIYGVQIVVGQGLTTLCLATIVAWRLARHEPFSRWFEAGHFHDLGNLMLAFVMLWAYMSFSQFLIIWSGNLPEEISWYLHRMHSGWNAIALLLVLGHFAVPFLILLNRRVKRSPAMLAKVALFLLVLRFLDYVWILVPAFHHGEFAISWMELLAPVAIGGLWIWAFVRGLHGRPLVSLQDSRLLTELEEGAAT